MLSFNFSYETLCTATSRVSALAGCDNREPLLLYLSVSSNTVSAILAKDLYGGQHHIYYVSKSLLDPETRYSYLEKLILSLVTTSTKLRHYFETHPIAHILIPTIEDPTKKLKDFHDHMETTDVSAIEDPDSTV